MLNTLKDYTKRQPRLFDFLQSLRRPDGEQERWLDAFSRQHDRLRFIQIGAADGLRWDPLRYFIIRDRWRGLFVEPLPGVFELLRQNYAYRVGQGLAFANTLISDTDGEATFWTVRKELLQTLPIESGLGLLREASLTREHIRDAVAVHFSGPDEKIVPLQVPSLTFDSLIAKYWQHDAIDLVNIDAEGYDDYIVKSINLQKHRPAAIVFEAHKLPEQRRSDIYEWLTAGGYHVQPACRGRGDAIATRTL
jgi:FkbM family methyltransferase